MSREYQPPYIDTIRRCAEIPNAPYLYGASGQFLTATLDSFGLDRRIDAQSNGAFYSQDQYATYVRIKNGDSPYKLLITTHLDHPFLVLDGKGTGQAVGSIEMRKLMQSKKGIPVEVYSNEGEFLSIESINDLSEDGGKVTVTQDSKYPPNSHGIWNIEPAVIIGDTLHMRNADNAVNTAIMLSLIQQLSISAPYGTNIEFIFCNLEEVAQISATAIGLRGETPYGRIDENTFALVLESASVVTHVDDYPVLERLGLKPASYSGGLVLRLNDREVVYGQRSTRENMLEHVLLNALSYTNTNYQQTILSGVCDATALTLFTETSNIASLTIPTRNKHNIDERGNLVHEQLLLSDIDGSFQTINSLIHQMAQGSFVRRNDAICYELKSSKLVADIKELEALQKVRLGALAWSETRLRNGVFYPEGITQSALCLMDSIKSRMI